MAASGYVALKMRVAPHPRTVSRATNRDHTWMMAIRPPPSIDRRGVTRRG
jgi:hypothetical protein